MITYNDFAKLEIKIGKIVACEKVENADKLLKLTVDFGVIPTSVGTQMDVDSGQAFRPRSLQSEARMTESEKAEVQKEVRTIVSGIAQWYKPEDLVGKLCPFLVNLEPRMLRGVESQGMILAADPGGSAVLLHPDKEIPEGSMVR